MGNPKALTTGHLGKITIQLIGRRKTNRMDHPIKAIPVLSQIHKGLFNLRIIGHVTGKHQRGIKLGSKIIDPFFEFVVGIGKSKLSTFTMQCLRNAISDGQFTGNTSDQKAFALQ